MTDGIDLAAIRAREQDARGLLTHHARDREFYADRCATDWERWPCDSASVRDSAADVPALLQALSGANARAERLAEQAMRSLFLHGFVTLKGEPKVPVDEWVAASARELYADARAVLSANARSEGG